MELWLVRDVPAWLVGLLLLGGLPAVVLLLDLLVHRAMSHRRLGRHNLVTGVMVAAVGVAYGVMMGLCVVTLWEGLSDAEHTTRQEAANLAGLVPASRVFGPETERRFADEVIRYNEQVVADWPRLADGETSPAVTAGLQRIADLTGSLRPATAAQQSFVDTAVDRIDQAQALRSEAQFEATNKQMSAVMWVGVLTATAAILGLIMLFGLDDVAVRGILLTLATMVVASNLFLVVQMNYPYVGAFSVGSDTFAQVVEDLRGGAR